MLPTSFSVALATPNCSKNYGQMALPAPVVGKVVLLKEMALFILMIGVLRAEKGRGGIILGRIEFKSLYICMSSIIDICLVKCFHQTILLDFLWQAQSKV